MGENTSNLHVQLKSHSRDELIEAIEAHLKGASLQRTDSDKAIAKSVAVGPTQRGGWVGVWEDYDTPGLSPMAEPLSKMFAASLATTLFDGDDLEMALFVNGERAGSYEVGFDDDESSMKSRSENLEAWAFVAGYPGASTLFAKVFSSSPDTLLLDRLIEVAECLGIDASSSWLHYVDALDEFCPVDNEAASTSEIEIMNFSRTR